MIHVTKNKNAAWNKTNLFRQAPWQRCDVNDQPWALKTQSAPLTITWQKHQTAMLGKQLHLAAQCYTQITCTAQQPKELKAVLPPPPPPPPPNLQETCRHDFGHTCPENAHLRHRWPSQWLLLHWTKLSTSLFHSKENASATHKLQTNNIFRQERFTVQECAVWKGKVQSTSIT